MNMNTQTLTREDNLIQAHCELFEAESAGDWKRFETHWHAVIAVMEQYETQQHAGLLNHLRGYLFDAITYTLGAHVEGSPHELENLLNALLTFSRVNGSFGGYPDVFWLRVLSVAMDAKLSMTTLDAIVSVWFATTDRDFRLG